MPVSLCRWIGLFVAMVCLFATLPAAAATAVQITLPAQAALPKSPGYFVLKAEVDAGTEKFPLYFGLFLPATYFRSTAPMPVVVTLHNVGCGDSEGRYMTGEGLPSMWTQDVIDARTVIGRDYDPAGVPLPTGAVNVRKAGQFVGVAPAIPTGRVASDGIMPQAISELVSELGKVYRLDDDRVYLTGFSYGGTCTWKIAEQMPGRFAAIAPISCRKTDDPAKTAQLLRNLPVYLACGTTDWSPRPCRRMADALTRSGHSYFIFRTIDGGTHWCYPIIYSDPAFWQWLLSQRRGAPVTTQPATRNAVQQ